VEVVIVEAGLKLKRRGDHGCTDTVRQKPAITLLNYDGAASPPPRESRKTLPSGDPKMVSLQINPGLYSSLGERRGSAAPGGYIESFNARLRDELLNGEIFYTLREAQIVIESWRRHYNAIRPHASIGYKPPAPEVFVPAFAAWPAALRRPGSAGHASATAHLKLTFHLDHSVGANQSVVRNLALLWQIYSGRRSLQIHFRQCKAFTVMRL